MNNYLPKGDQYTYPKDAIEVHEFGYRVKFSSQGGGFIKSLPRDRFEADFREVTPLDEKGYYQTYFSIEGHILEPDHSVGVYDNTFDCTSFKGYTLGFRWNGWATPSFTKETALKVVEGMNDVHFDEDRDAFILKTEYDDEEDDVFQGYDILVDGETIHVYPVGSGFWIWDQDEEEEIIK